MPVEVEIISEQILGEHREKETNKSNGEITYHQKGAVLQFTEKYEDQELNFKMTILEDKIITLRNGQNMTFDKKTPNHTTLNTPYGILNMTITTNEINVIKHEEKIKEIHLFYHIELENSMEYDNKVDIYLKEK